MTDEKLASMGGWMNAPVNKAIVIYNPGNTDLFVTGEGLAQQSFETANAQPTSAFTRSMHEPVLLDEVVAALQPLQGTLIVDAPFGAGGYLRRLLETGATVRAFDRDPDTDTIAPVRPWSEATGDQPRLVPHLRRFSEMVATLAKAGVLRADGVVMDISVSSMQLDRPARGFAFSSDGPLYIQMGQDGSDVVAGSHAMSCVVNLSAGATACAALNRAVYAAVRRVAALQQCATHNIGCAGVDPVTSKVTGTNGKTSVTEMIHKSLLNASHNTTTMCSVGVVANGTTMNMGFAKEGLAHIAFEASIPATEAVTTICAITVEGSQRLEPDTIRSYIKMRIGQPYTQVSAEQVLKDLYATELFAGVQVHNDDGNVIITVTENPVVSRIVLEGNKRIKEEKILPEIKVAPRQIFTRSKVRADVARIIELYKRQGRFTATVEPKMVMLEQNRVDIVFEINEGPKSKVRQINIIGNEKFSDGDLRGEMVTKQTGFTRMFSSGTSYDPDRMAFDQQKLRQFYLTKGYADFHVISAVAELTSDKKDFVITYVVGEGERREFDDVKAESCRLRHSHGEIANVGVVRATANAVVRQCQHAIGAALAPIQAVRHSTNWLYRHLVLSTGPALLRQRIGVAEIHLLLHRQVELHLLRPPPRTWWARIIDPLYFTRGIHAWVKPRLNAPPTALLDKNFNEAPVPCGLEALSLDDWFNDGGKVQDEADATTGSAGEDDFVCADQMMALWHGKRNRLWAMRSMSH